MQNYIRSQLLNAAASLCLFSAVILGCAMSSAFAETTAINQENVPQDFLNSALSAAEIELAERFISAGGMSAGIGISILDSLAKDGNVRAQAELGMHYTSGSHGIVTREDAGQRLLKAAAAQHDPLATAYLALETIQNKKTEDYGQALRWAQDAAGQQYAPGYLVLGVIYGNGYGVPRNVKLARENLLKAANLREAAAMTELARLYRDNSQSSSDNILAFTWASLAVAEHGASVDAYDAKIQEDTALPLLPQEVIEGRHLADTWTPGDDLMKRLEADLKVLATTRRRSMPESVLFAGPLFPASLPRTKVSNIPLVERHFTEDVEFRLDGTTVYTHHAEIEPRSAASISQVAQIPLSYDNDMGGLDIVEAYTLKADGRKLQVDPSAILVQQAPDSQDNFMFADRRRKVVIFPNVEVGDIVVYTARWTRTPLLPGLASWRYIVDPTMQDSDVHLTLTVPKSLHAFIESHGLQPDQHSDGNKTIYRWNYATRRPLSSYPIDLRQDDRAPRIFASTFGSYEEFVDAYAPLVWAKLKVTPELEHLANQLTAGISNRRQQAKALYDWVSHHIRYVGLEFGEGSIVPHDTATILQNGYGDCKDHSLIFAALLKAKGIDSDVVLIDSGWGMTMSLPPTVGNFDHMITYLPEFDLYADTTAEIAPFGTLPFNEYGKPVLLVPQIWSDKNIAVVRRVPILKPNVATATGTTTAELKADGTITGDSETVATGPYGLRLRGKVMEYESRGFSQAAKDYLKDSGYDATGEFSLPQQDDSSDRYRLKGHFETVPYTGLLHGSQFQLPQGLSQIGVTINSLMGDPNFKGSGDEPTYCWSGRQTEDLSLKLPPGKKVKDLPSNTKIVNDYITYESTWSIAGKTVAVHREFVSNISSPVCVGRARTEAAKVLAAMRVDSDVKISLTDE